MDEETVEAVALFGDVDPVDFPEVHRFVVPHGCHWQDVRGAPANVGAAALTHAMRETERQRLGSTAGGAVEQYWWQPGIDAEIAGAPPPLTAIFTATPVALLGRRDFFRAFKVAFNEREKTFTVTQSRLRQLRNRKPPRNRMLPAKQRRQPFSNRGGGGVPRAGPIPAGEARCSSVRRRLV